MNSTPNPTNTPPPPASPPAEPPAPPASPPNPIDRRKPSRGWYGLAFALMLIGVAAFTASLNAARTQVAQRLDAMQRFVAPGTTPLTFGQPGRYLVYYEKVGQIDNENFDTSGRFPEMPRMDIDLRHDATDTYLTLDRAEDTESQMFNHGRANSEFAFTVTPEQVDPTSKAASYTLTATHLNDIDDRLLIAVGPPVVGQMMSQWRGPFGGAALLAFAFVISATTVLVTWTLRNGKVTRRED